MTPYMILGVKPPEEGEDWVKPDEISDEQLDCVKELIKNIENLDLWPSQIANNRLKSNQHEHTLYITIQDTCCKLLVEYFFVMSLNSLSQT